MAHNDLTKEQLYQGVKILVEAKNQHLHLTQQKLYTLFSLAFQYMVYMSCKNKGIYLVRIEDSQLADKLIRNAKDPSTRKFLRALMLPRKLKYSGSVFYLDFFHIGSWSITQKIPSDKFRGAIIVKNTAEKLMIESADLDVLENEDSNDQESIYLKKMSAPDFFLESLLDFVPKTITIAYDHTFEKLTEIEFPFIQKSKEKINGITVSKEIDLESFKD